MLRCFVIDICIYSLSVFFNYKYSFSCTILSFELIAVKECLACWFILDCDNVLIQQIGLWTLLWVFWEWIRSNILVIQICSAFSLEGWVIIVYFFVLWYRYFRKMDQYIILRSLDKRMDHRLFPQFYVKIFFFWVLIKIFFSFFFLYAPLALLQISRGFCDTTTSDSIPQIHVYL